MENERAEHTVESKGAKIRETKIKQDSFRLCWKRMSKIEKEGKGRSNTYSILK